MIWKRKAKLQKSGTLLGIDLGANGMKGAVLTRAGDKNKLASFAVRNVASPSLKPESIPQYAEELVGLLTDLKTSERQACVTVSCASAMVCQSEFPRMPIEEVKNALKLNSSRYLRRDFSNYLLDAVELVDETADEEAVKKSGKMQVLVGGALKEEVQWYRDVVLAAKIRPLTLELSAVSVVNALQMCMKELCEKEVVILVDIGARSTSINFLDRGQPVITRIMRFGGQQITDFVAQMLTLEAKAAEEEKLQMSGPVQALVRTSLLPLAREIRSSIDFFERQHDRHLVHAFACGGTARSASILDFLSEEVGLRIECCNPVQGLEIAHLNGQTENLQLIAPSLAAVLGVAGARL
jgi:type IV pilus assembly protein PilM